MVSGLRARRDHIAEGVEMLVARYITQSQKNSAIETAMTNMNGIANVRAVGEFTTSFGGMASGIWNPNTTSDFNDTKYAAEDAIARLDEEIRAAGRQVEDCEDRIFTLRRRIAYLS
jgi:hypothetical protein